MAGDMPGTYEPPSAEQWAALQKLPEEERLHTGVVAPSEGDEEAGTKGAATTAGEADLRLLSSAQRAKLVAKVLETSDQDNELLMQKLRTRLENVGLSFPSVEVRFENLEVEAHVYLGTRALPTLLNFTLNMAVGILRSLRIIKDTRRPFPILHGVSSVIKPNRLTLLLGPPGSGKSTLMKALSGTIDDDLQFSGDITYNGHTFSEFVPERTSLYVPQSDNHIGEMTVRETLDFSARVQGPGYKAELIKELERREAEAKVVPDASLDAFMKASALNGNPTSVVTDYILKILGLDICSETMLGNEMVRGVSGGQKKRVTTGEMIVGPKQVLFMDEISTGLDSSTTYLITRCLAHLAHSQGATVVVALLQPAPETYDIFDDILLLSEGHIIYHGPRTEVVPFFEYMGFRCPERKGVADFLQEITSMKDQQQYWVKDTPYSYVSVEQFAHAFQESVHGKEIAATLSTPYPKEKSPEGVLQKERYGIPHKEMIKATFSRELLLMKRNAFLYIAQTINLLITALITCTVFFRTTLELTVQDGNFYLGAIFFGLISMLFNGFAELSLLTMRLHVFYKQRDQFLYPAWAWELPMAILSIPFSLWSAFLWTSVTYWVIGFAPEASRFFCQMLLFFLVHQTSITLFRLIGAIGRSEVVSNTFGAFALILLFLLGGFILAKPDIKPWWIWGFWISPLMYGQNALAVNEFLAPRWQIPLSPDAPPDVTVGLTVLGSRGLFTDQYWRWIGVGALIGFVILFNFLCILALQYLNPWGKPQPVVSEDMLEEKHASRTGDLASIEALRSRHESRLKSSGRGSALEKYRTSAASSSGSFVKKMSGASKAAVEAAVGAATTVGKAAVDTAAGVGKVAVDAAGTAVGTAVSAAGTAVSAAGTAVSAVAHAAHLDGGAATDGSAAVAAGSGVVGGESTESRRGMVLPFKPLSLSFHNVNYYVDMPAEMKAEGATGDKLQLLRNVTGAFQPKVLTALVGVSGAGKTTLMDVLAGRKTGGYIEGDVRVSGYPKVQETFARIAGYCEQNDIHTPQVTVHESLLYSAWLRLPQEVGKDVREEFVEEIMELVELDALRDALVGLPGVNGLSTEQRKRLTIAVELVANPSIIFMDEPTSGLDARAAAIVMRTVRNTVDTGRTVVCTIHQPSIDIFEAFDELLLMKRGGEVIYMGPLGKNSQTLVDYFEAVPGVPKITEGYNPATWMLEISSPAASEKMGVDFAEIFRNSEQFKRNEALIEQLKTPPAGSQDLHFPTTYSTSYATQFYASLWKRSRMYWRAPDYNAVRYFFCTIMALVVGGVFFGLGRLRGTQQQVFNVMGALYTASLFMGWNNAASVQPIVAHERTVFYRERAAGLYAPLPYALAQGAIEIPYVLVQTIIYSLITYAMIGFEWTAPKFFWYFVFMLLTLFYFTCYGLMSISITPNEQLSMVVSAFFFSIWNLLCGFLIPRNSIPWWWRWFYYINPVAWTLYGLIVSQLGTVYTIMEIPGVPPDQWPPVAIFLEDYFGYYYNMIGYIVLILICFVILFFAVFTYALKKLNFQHR